MFTKYGRFVPGALVALALIAAPAVHAGGALLLMPADDRDVPSGSFIPERRIQAVEQMVTDYKQRMLEPFGGPAQEAAAARTPTTSR